jgi:ribose 5-phosphate isomerase A
MSSNATLKRRAAEQAVDQVRSGMALGLGSGSTMRFVLDELGRRLASGQLSAIVGVPTSEQTAQIARDLGIPLSDFAQHPDLDLALDGADEIDPQLGLIKGNGGALVREKIVASAARRLIIVADGSKLVAQLGSVFAVPIEVIPLAIPLITRRLSARGGGCTVRSGPDGQPYLTDNGNLIIDYACGPIADPAALDLDLLRMPGIVDHGLFLGMADLAIVADAQGVRLIGGG